jgi:hypothetical protein
MDHWLQVDEQIRKIGLRNLVLSFYRPISDLLARRMCWSCRRIQACQHWRRRR